MKKETIHYVPLLAILFFGFMGFYLSPYDRIFQISVVLATSVGYFTWGVVHHYIHKDLHITIVLEYLAISVFGVVSILLLLLRT